MPDFLLLPSAFGWCANCGCSEPIASLYIVDAGGSGHAISVCEWCWLALDAFFPSSNQPSEFLWRFDAHRGYEE